MNPVNIIYRFYAPGLALTDTLIHHSEQVRDKALEVAEGVPHLQPDLAFIAEAAMLHDIGICQTASAKIGCLGTHPYICHGILGRQMLDQLGLAAHALVCERHVGVGISPRDIREQGLPLPLRSMVPATLEEIIICYADKFFSKSNGGSVHSVQAVIADLKPFGTEKVERFMQWHRMLAGE